MNSTLNILDYIMLVMGVYVLISGIRGKGRLYSTENIKEELLEKFISITRKLYIALGIVMSLNGLASVLRYSFYTVQEITPATETAPAVYDWVLTKDLGAFSFLTIPVLNIITYVCIALAVGLLVWTGVVINKMTDKNKRASGQSSGSGSGKQAGHTLPVSAFDFTDDSQSADAHKDDKA